MCESFTCFGIETSHQLKVVLLFDVEHVGCITLKDVLQGVLARLFGHVVRQTVDVCVVREWCRGEHVVGIDRATVHLTRIVDEGERVVEVDGEILHRRYLRA